MVAGDDDTCRTLVLHQLLRPPALLGMYFSTATATIVGWRSRGAKLAASGVWRRGRHRSKKPQLDNEDGGRATVDTRAVVGGEATGT